MAPPPTNFYQIKAIIKSLRIGNIWSNTIFTGQLKRVQIFLIIIKLVFTLGFNWTLDTGFKHFILFGRDFDTRVV